MSNRNQKTIFITGASSGLGRATVKLFASKGWNVIATMRNPEKETELSQLSGLKLLPLDVTDPDQIKETAERVVAMNGVDVRTLGMAWLGRLKAFLTSRLFAWSIRNTMGAIRITKAFIPYFREKRAGLFINTTSIGGLIAVPFNAIYHATKWALEGWSESMAFELESVWHRDLKRSRLVE